MAAPHVAGAAAQLRGANPSWSAGTVSRVLECMATTGVVSGVSTSGISGTPNRFLYAGAALANADLECRFPPNPPVSPPTPLGCREVCIWSSDGDCDDGYHARAI
eukprot:3228283-Prymnesium_polylepis.3